MLQSAHQELLLAGGSKTPEPDPSTLHHTSPVALDLKTKLSGATNALVTAVVKLQL